MGFRCGVHVYVSVILVRVLLSELRRRGLSDEQLLEGSSVDVATLSNLRATISLEEWGVLLLRALEITNDPALGLALGEHWSQSTLQVVGQLIVSCRTMREAIQMFERYRPLLGNNYRWTLTEDGSRAHLYLDSEAEHPLASRVSMEAVMALTYRIGKNFPRIGDDASDEALFRFQAPSYAAQYKRIFQCQVRFGQERYGFVFPRAYLDIAQPHGDETVQEVLRSSADVLLRERESESVAERVRAILRYEQDVARVDVRRIATELGLNVRALRRRLGAEHAPLSALLDEARLRFAKRALRNQGATIKEVAHGLGFSEASAFHRAFKRWSGQTPAQYIKEAMDDVANPNEAPSRA